MLSPTYFRTDWLRQWFPGRRHARDCEPSASERVFKVETIRWSQSPKTSSFSLHASRKLPPQAGMRSGGRYITAGRRHLRPRACWNNQRPKKCQSRPRERLSGSPLTPTSRQPTPNSVQGPNPDNSSKPSGQVDRSAVPNVPVLRYGQRTASKFRFRINSSSTVTQLGEYSRNKPGSMVGFVSIRTNRVEVAVTTTNPSFWPLPLRIDGPLH